MEHLRAHLLALLDYEEWANQLWRQVVPDMNDPARGFAIMRHILSCYSGWAPSVSNWVEPSELNPSNEELWSQLYEKWRDVIQSEDLDRVVEFGPGRRARVGELVHHVLNHGTYHRGHLRGLAEAQGFVDFPETDSVRWFIKQHA